MRTKILAVLIMLMAVTFSPGCERRGGIMENHIQDGSKQAVADGLVKLAKCKIYFGHQSVGENIIAGIKDIAQATGVKDLSIVETRYPSDFGSPVFAHSSIGHNEDPISKCDEFKKIMENGVGDRVDIAFFKLCFVDIGRNSDIDHVYKHYVETIKYLEDRFPGVTFLAVTVPLTVYGEGIKTKIKRLLKYPIANDSDNAKRFVFNELLRRKYQPKGNLFDLALYESIYADGQINVVPAAGESTQYLIKDYSYDGGHLNAAGRMIIAERLIVFLNDMSNSEVKK